MHSNKFLFSLISCRFFSIKPDAVALFSRVKGDNIYSPDFRAHMARVNTGLDQCLSLLDDQEVLDAQLAHLKTQHATLGVGADMFEVSYFIR